jgi:hypothetical protein
MYLLASGNHQQTHKIHPIIWGKIFCISFGWKADSSSLAILRNEEGKATLSLRDGTAFKFSLGTPAALKKGLILMPVFTRGLPEGSSRSYHAVLEWNYWRMPCLRVG